MRRLAVARHEERREGVARALPVRREQAHCCPRVGVAERRPVVAESLAERLALAVEAAQVHRRVEVVVVVVVRATVGRG